MFSELKYGLTAIASQYRVNRHLLWLESILDHLIALAQIVDIKLRVSLIDAIKRLVLFEIINVINVTAFMLFKDFCRSLDLLAESVIVAGVRHLDCPFKPDCAMDASFYNASKVDSWVHDAIHVNNLIC